MKRVVHTSHNHYPTSRNYPRGRTIIKVAYEWLPLWTNSYPKHLSFYDLMTCMFIDSVKRNMWTSALPIICRLNDTRCCIYEEDSHDHRWYSTGTQFVFGPYAVDERKRKKIKSSLSYSRRHSRLVHYVLGEELNS